MNDYLTRSDLDTYGPDLINLSRRVANTAIAPLQQRLAIEARRNLDLRVERAVPNYREIDRDPAWHRWLLGIDELSGRVRQQLLNDAIASGSDARIATFFQKFQQGGDGAQGGAATRTRRPAPGQSNHVYTRPEIAQLYERRRKGELTDAAFAKIEADIFTAQRENRIAMADYITK